MNFISEIFKFGALQIQVTARGSEGASIGFGSHFQLLVAEQTVLCLSKPEFSGILLSTTKCSQNINKV